MCLPILVSTHRTTDVGIRKKIYRRLCCPLKLPKVGTANFFPDYKSSHYSTNFFLRPLNANPLISHMGISLNANQRKARKSAKEIRNFYYKTIKYFRTYLHQRGLFSTGACLYHRSLSCTWICLPGQQEPVLLLDVSPRPKKAT
jgi:hypothetical protein